MVAEPCLPGAATAAIGARGISDAEQRALPSSAAETGCGGTITSYP